MKFTVSSSALSKQLAAISGVVANNPIVPILENFLFSIIDKTLTVTASDLQTAITATLAVEAENNVSIAIPARTLLETLRNLPEQPVTFSVDEDTYSVAISSSNGRYRLAGENATDFPQIGMERTSTPVDMPADVLKKAIRQTLVAASTDELRPAMNGVHMDFQEDKATFVATDGHRLVRYIRSDIGVSAQRPFIVPKKTLILLNNLLPSDNPTVTVAFNDNYVCFQVGNTSMVSRLIDERFPDYDNVIPTNNTSTLTVNRIDFMSSLKRIVIYANKTTYMTKLAMADNALQIAAEDFDFSNEASEQIKCEYTDDPLEICFNARFLIEMLANLPTEEVSMTFSTPSKASLIFPKEQSENEDLVLLIMPVILQ